MSDRPSMPPVLSVVDVHKIYPSGTHALRSVSLDIMPGKVHGLIGANGAGKSTLIKILSGVQTATSGSVAWHGEPVAWTSPAQALSAGMAAVHQHTPLVDTMTVVDNVFLGRRESRRWDAGRRAEQLAALCERIGYPLDPSTPVSRLSMGGRQMICILQALARDPAVVLLDEPTAALSPTERDVLFRTIRRLRDQGTTFVYVSHFLDEILDLTDHLTVLRDGRVVIDAATPDTSKEQLVTAIVGERLARMEERPRTAHAAGGEPVLTVENLSSPQGFGPVSLDIRPGEVVGVAGLLGSGRTELLQAIFGADPAATGRVAVAGRRVRPGSPHTSVKRGLALVPEDRTRQALLPEWEIWRNISLPYLPGLSRWRLLLDPARERELAGRALADLGIAAPSAEALVGELSGGNAQKVVFAKWLYGPARVFLLDEPSAGVDVGGKADITQLIRGLADAGHAVLIVASEFEELLSACDRVLVMRRGRLIAERSAAATDLHELTALASGL
ncbi:MAG: ribose transport system ATP-binding protein [Streptomycetaceae bacterium]|jgi:ribose transport system ATP-binding protein|nr:ribose transport system ATP-binding protein [Streptomycetaceae bacterium]